MGAYMCDVCAREFTEKRSLSRHKKNTHDEKTVTHVSYAIKFMGKQRICLDMKPVHTLNQLKCNVRNVRKRLQEHTI